MITIENLKKKYGSGFSLTVNSLQLDKADRLAVVGLNGSGKSTLMKLIAGIERPDSGSITFSDPGRIIYQPQHPYVFRGSVRDNVRIAASSDGICDEMIRLFELEQFADRTAKDLSGGEKQRMFLARSFSRSCSVLMLDEPLSAVDLDTGSRLTEKILSLCRERSVTLLIASHLPAQALSVADRILLMDNGNARCYADRSDFIQDPDVFVRKFISQWKWD